MSEEEPQSTIVIVERRAFEVTAYKRSLESHVLTVVTDRGEQWSFDVAGWRGWSFGASWGEFYIWTARQLISFPNDAAKPVELEVDEDVLSVFKVDLGWLVVCETSIRLLGGQREFARVECGDVIDTVHWDNGRLVVLDQSGSQSVLTIRASELIFEAAG